MWVPTNVTACPPASARDAIARAMLPVPTLVILSLDHRALDVGGRRRPEVRVDALDVALAVQLMDEDRGFAELPRPVARLGAGVGERGMFGQRHGVAVVAHHPAVARQGQDLQAVIGYEAPRSN